MISQIIVKGHILNFEKKNFSLSLKSSDSYGIWLIWVCQSCEIELITFSTLFTITKRFYYIDDFVNFNDLFSCNEVIVKNIIE